MSRFNVIVHYTAWRTIRKLERFGDIVTVHGRSQFRLEEVKYKGKNVGRFERSRYKIQIRSRSCDTFSLSDLLSE